MSQVLIVDDHALFRRGVALILGHALPTLVLGEAGDAAEALLKLEQGRWDLLILDVELPGLSGMEVLRDVRIRRPSLPVLMLTGYQENDFGLQALQDGAKGYLNKDCAACELVDAVSKLLAGGRYITPTLADKLAASFSTRPAQPPLHSKPDLAGRILEVVLSLARGRTVKEIAADLNLSVKTVSTYRKRALVQLRLNSTADLVRHCLRHGLVK
jgi:DNA-binding NarL/FixJ family response regulator